MAETNFPNGISIPAGHTGSITPNVTGTGKREAWGTAIIAAGIGTVATGLTTCEYAVAQAYGQLIGGGGQFGGAIAVQPTTSGGLIVRSYDGATALSTQSGTVAWRAVGT